MSILLKTRETFLRIRNNNYFESFVAFIIILSALNVGINTYEGIPTNYLSFLSAIDYVITVFFLIEIIIRMISEESLKNHEVVYLMKSQGNYEVVNPGGRPQITSTPSFSGFLGTPPQGVCGGSLYLFFWVCGNTCRVIF